MNEDKNDVIVLLSISYEVFGKKRYTKQNVTLLYIGVTSKRSKSGF